MNAVSCREGVTVYDDLRFMAGMCEESRLEKGSTRSGLAELNC